MIGRLKAILKRRSLLENAVLVADRALRPLGVSLLSFTRFGVYVPSAKGETPQERFDDIAKQSVWQFGESLSGGGSELDQSAPYRTCLIKFIRERRVKFMFDAPCGDLHWMRHVLDQVDIAYAGGDISPHIVELNRTRFPDLSFDVFDITKDRFPEAEVWHCRDCLFHLSYADIRSALRNFAESDIPYALITSHQGIVRNLDIESGGWRYLNLTRAPFNFPAPEVVLKDYRPGDLPQIVGMWSRKTIARLLSTDSSVCGASPSKAEAGNS